jgi:hypothetical protein
MRHRIALALIVGSLLTSPAAALELSNLRVTAGAVGEKRASNKFLPGDIIHLHFDILDLQLDSKDNLTAKYQTTLEILDKEEKSVFKEQTPPRKIVLLGGKQLRSNAFAVLGAAQGAGKYKVKLTVNDLNAKQEKTLFYEFEVLPAAFGLVQPNTAAVAFAGFDFTVGFSVVGMKRDKGKVPDVEFTLDVLDELGKSVLTQPWKFNVQIFHNPPTLDITTKEVIPVYFTIFLNKTGKYTIQVDAVDENSKEKTQMKFSLKVLDLADFTGK